MSGGHYLAQSRNVYKLRQSAGFDIISQSKGMKAINDESRNISHKDLLKNRKSTLDKYRKSFDHSQVGSEGLYRQGVNDIKNTYKALQHSKLKRNTGKIALAAGGLGALAYGASKLRNKNQD